MKRLALLLLGLLVGVGVLLALALEGEPLVLRGEALNPRAVGQARDLFKANDPRHFQRGETRQVALPATLLDEAANFLAGRYLKGRGALSLTDEAVELRFTRALPAGRFLNLRLAVALGEGEPRLRSVSVGQLPLPAGLAEKGLTALLARFNRDAEWHSAKAAVRALARDAQANALVVRYVWEPDLLRQARSVALEPAEVARLETAQKALAALVDHRAAGSPVPLAEILKPRLSDARDRPGRKAALLVLAVYLYEKDLAALVPQAKAWPQPRRVKLILAHRHDSAQHFGVSAAVAAWAGEPAADAVGLYKELEDARRGSGFSFADLAADRAGTRFGEAVAGGSSRLEAALAGPFGEADFMPSLADLPEFLHQPEFSRRVGGPGSPAYRRLADEIERRIAALPLHGA